MPDRDTQPKLPKWPANLPTAPADQDAEDGATTAARLQPGDRVHHPRWNLYGTVIRDISADLTTEAITDPDIDLDGPASIGVCFDGTSIEVECALTELDQVAGRHEAPPPSFLVMGPYRIVGERQ